MPKLYIIAGPNGSGKTTFAREFLPHYAKCANFINADLIALGLSPFAPAVARIKAGKEYYAPLSDSWILFDNSSGKPKEIGQMTNKHIEVLNKGFYRSFIGDKSC